MLRYCVAMDIMNQLSNLGYRRTKTRAAILTIFERTREPLSAVELQKLLLKKVFSIRNFNIKFETLDFYTNFTLL